jgi:hypothetical protein
MPVVLRSIEKGDEWLRAEPRRIEEIQSGILPAEALETVGDDEAAELIGGCLSGGVADRIIYLLNTIH